MSRPHENIPIEQLYEQVVHDDELIVELAYRNHELLRSIVEQNGLLMALGQDILDAVTAEDTKVDSFIALVQGLISDGTIPPAVGSAILEKVKGSEDKLDAAIAANTPPAVPPVTP